jgi:hypothetical protein
MGNSLRCISVNGILRMASVSSYAHRANTYRLRNRIHRRLFNTAAHDLVGFTNYGEPVE